MKGLTKKHGVKMVGAWTVMPEHLVIFVYEAPSFESFQKFVMEPAMLKMTVSNTTEIKPAMTLKEGMELLK